MDPTVFLFLLQPLKKKKILLIVKTFFVIFLLIEDPKIFLEG